MTKKQLIDALRAFISQRSGISFADYGERESFMQDYRQVLKHGRHARALLSAIEWRDSITAQDIVDASNRAFSGRLQFKQREGGAVAVDYCAGQYFVTEYRAAACAVLASVLWQYWRTDSSTADDIRKQARKELGRGIAAEWFN